MAANPQKPIRSGHQRALFCFLGLLWLALGVPGLLAKELGELGESGAHQFVQLSGDYLSMSAVRPGSTPSQLAVFVLHPGPRPRRRSAQLLVKRGSTLQTLPEIELPPDSVAYDVCPLRGPLGGETVVILRPDGLYPLGSATPLVKAPLVTAHQQELAFPRVRVCFPVGARGEVALVLPLLDQIKVFQGSGSGPFRPIGTIPLKADLRFQSALLRDEALASTQRLAFRLELPDVQWVDFNGDGQPDLCLTLGDRLRCRLQMEKIGFGGPDHGEITQDLRILTPAEELDTNIRIDSRLVDLSGDGRPDLVIAKINWNLAQLGTELWVYHQTSQGTFPPQPTQKLQRKGFFSYQEYFDLDGDGRIDIVAPFAAIDWTELARIYLSRNVDIDFLWFRNQGGRLAEQGQTLHSVTYPVEFKNLPAILGALPLWSIPPSDLGTAPKIPAAKGPLGQRLALFFPRKKAAELRAISLETGQAQETLWRHEAPLGSDPVLIDLDQDGASELYMGYPRDPQRKSQILMIRPDL